MGELNQPYVKPRRAAVRDYRSIVALRIEQAQAVLAKQHRCPTVSVREARPGITIAMVTDPDGNTVEFLQNSASK